ncbi:ferritin subunit-like [Anopheles aquasalis]|uniref:Ferritin n=1 Tax=Anopheles aquasalis TaxID=42839 RepID=T1DHK6_ANOAQ|nr:ferritin subunit-like [Anopheles aquasalis]XP_050088831.1 ferritin subunit-like [Anopheles aquasalis]XP_050088832.1 ferritin subunit-like [Anopheles aquasalis]
MMKPIFFGVVALMFAVVVMQPEQVSMQAADGATATDSEKWNYMHKTCSSKLHDQINMEFGASLFYLQYAAYFAQYKVNLPGFEKFFFNAASEEREHGIKLIEYALMRGVTPISDSFNLAANYAFEGEPAAVNGSVALAALGKALAKEQEVTKSIRELIKICEGDLNDYHLVDYLTGEFLEEQHQGQRELAGKISMLNKMLVTNPELGEYIFDQQNM